MSTPNSGPVRKLVLILRLLCQVCRARRFASILSMSYARMIRRLDRCEALTWTHNAMSLAALSRQTIPVA
jgi:hypothetical protein